MTVWLATVLCILSLMAARYRSRDDECWSWTANNQRYMSLQMKMCTTSTFKECMQKVNQTAYSENILDWQVWHTFHDKSYHSLCRRKHMYFDTWCALTNSPQCILSCIVHKNRLHIKDLLVHLTPCLARPQRRLLHSEQLVGLCAVHFSKWWAAGSSNINYICIHACLG